MRSNIKTSLTHLDDIRSSRRRAPRAALLWLGAIGGALAIGGCSSAARVDAQDEAQHEAQNEKVGSATQADGVDEVVTVTATAKSGTEIDLSYSYWCDDTCQGWRNGNTLKSMSITRSGPQSKQWTPKISDPESLKDTGLTPNTYYSYSVCYNPTVGAAVCGSFGAVTGVGAGAVTGGWGEIPSITIAPDNENSRISVAIHSDHPYEHYNVQWGVACANTNKPCGPVTQWDSQWDPDGGKGSQVNLSVGPTGNTGSYFVNVQGCDFVALFNNSRCSGWSVPITMAAPTGVGSSGSALTTAPAITSISPNSGLPEGGLRVQITGTAFGPETYFRFGEQLATSVQCTSSTLCYATTPPGGGRFDVLVWTHGMGLTLEGQVSPGDVFSYVPSVLSVTPSTGKAGDRVTIKGLGFSYAPGAMSLTFGDSPVTDFTCYPGPDCSAVVPPGAGVVDVRATVNGHVTGLARDDIFSYDAPTITSMSASSGSIAGGTEFDIVGTGFDPNVSTDHNMHVYFGTREAESVLCSSSQRCTVRSPWATAPGTVAVIVESFGVRSAPTDQDLFTYRSQAALTQLTWDAASQSAHVQIDGSAPPGGAVVTLTSSNPNALLPPATVTIPAGVVGASTNVTLVPTPAAGSATLTATYAGSTMSIPVSYVAWPLVTLDVDALTLDANQSTSLTVLLNTKAPAGGAAVALSSSVPSAIAVPASIVVPAGSQSATVSVTNVYSGASKNVSITVSYDGASASRTVAVPTAACKPRTCLKGTLWNADTCACEMP